MALILLLRDNLLPAIERFLSVCPADLFVSRENGVRPTDSALDLLKEALRYSQYRPETWRLCGQRKSDTEDLLFNSDDVRQAANLFEWCLMPWGSDYTAMMIALVSSDDRMIEQTKEMLLGLQCADLIVSHYTAAEVANHQFCGAIFNRGLGVCGEGIWERNGYSTAMVLTGEAGDLLTRKMPEAAEIITEIVGESFGMAVRHQWIRISTIAALLHYARFSYTKIIVAGDISENAIPSVIEKSKEFGRDQLRIGLAALQSATWIYVPKTERLGDEIYINRNPQETAKLIADERLASAPRFSLRCFC